MHPLGVHIISGVIGFVLIKGSITVWLAHIWPAWRRKVEHIFLRDRNLFEQNAPYSGTVQFFKWWALVPGALLILPRFVLLDVLIVLAVVALWRFFVARARQGYREIT